MNVRSICSAVIAVSVVCVSSAALADGTLSVESSKTKIAADRFIGVTYEIKSPRDIATGQATGKRQHSPVCVFKASSASTPQWFTVATLNEVLKSVTMETSALRIKLVNASVSELKFLGAEGKDLESICFTFEKIELSAKSGGATAADDWRVRP